MSYATIPIRNENKRLYSKNISPYVVRNQDQPEIHHVYDADTDLGSSIFFNDVSPCDSKVVVPNKCKKDKKEISEHEALERKKKEKE